MPGAPRQRTRLAKPGAAANPYLRPHALLPIGCRARGRAESASARCSVRPVRTPPRPAASDESGLQQLPYRPRMPRFSESRACSVRTSREERRRFRFFSGPQAGLLARTETVNDGFFDRSTRSMPRRSRVMVTVVLHRLRGPGGRRADRQTSRAAADRGKHLPGGSGVVLRPGKMARRLRHLLKRGSQYEGDAAHAST